MKELSSILASVVALVVLILGLRASNLKKKLDKAKGEAKTAEASVEAVKEHFTQKEERENKKADDIKKMEDATNEKEIIDAFNDFADKFNRPR